MNQGIVSSTISISGSFIVMITRFSLSREVFLLAAPAIGQSFLQTLVVFVDRVMLGRYSAEALASMQINGALLWSITSTLSAFAVGSVALVGRGVGGRDRALAAAVTRASLLLAVGIGLLISLVGWFGLDSILGLFPTQDLGVKAAANAYLSIILLVMPMKLISIAAATNLQAAGNTRTPFFVALMSNAVNLGVNYCLIFGNLGAPTLGIQGAALGSATAIALNALILLVILSHPHKRLTFRGRGGEREALKRLLKVAAPAFLERFVQHLGFLGFVGFISALGGLAMAANQALDSIESICYLSADGFGIAAAAIVSQRLGANRPQEAAIGAKIATFYAIALLGFFACWFLLIPSQLLSIFSQNNDMMEIGIPCLYVAALAQPFMATSIVLGQALRGAGDTKTAFYVSLAGWFLVRLSATYLFAFVLDLGLLGVWLGSTCDWVVRCFTLMAIFFRGKWHKVAV